VKQGKEQQQQALD